MGAVSENMNRQKSFLIFGERGKRKIWTNCDHFDSELTRVRALFSKSFISRSVHIRLPKYINA